jgi:nitrogenase molybdenum-iron protein alpha chain
MASTTERSHAEDKIITGERDLSTLMLDEPGIICKHGCSYMACRGLVLSPISGLFVITHGPVGCSLYSWGGHCFHYRSGNVRLDYSNYSFSTAMDERDVIFGGEKKLRQAIKEAVEIFHPPAIAICSTCPIGLIGDDIQSVAEEAEKEHGIKVLAFSCEGFRSVPGYRLANLGLMDNVLGSEEREVGKYPVNIIGEFHNGQRGPEIARILHYIGYDIVSVLMGEGSYQNLKNAHQAKLNLFGSDKVVKDLLEVMRDRFGTDWMRFNFIGTANITDSLKNLAAYFGAQELVDRTEDLIATELAQTKDSLDHYRNELRDKTAVIFEDEFVARHYRALLTELGIASVLVGHDLTCRPGQNEVSFLSTIQGGGAAKSESGLRYDVDLHHYHVNLPAGLYEQARTAIPADGSSRIHSNTAFGGILVSHLGREAAEQVLGAIRPDIYFPGIKERFPTVGVDYPSFFFNGDDYRFGYGGFGGAVHFAQDLLMAINMSGWRSNVAPWKASMQNRPNNRKGEGCSA